MNITVLTPDRKVFSGPIASVKVPGTNGEFQVLNNHAPIVSSLEAGNVVITTDNGEYRFFDQETGTLETANEAGRKIKYAIKGGFVEVLNNEVSLLVTGLS
ncbi:MAG: F0F1 ATP synthase subunit epsilon [Phaeodactylibacter sp.]|nr:F0F1 ATP synthase subunit epsilon [Phaeodactylibacter sp.]